MVRPFAREGDGVGAWKALMAQYGHESKELRQARLLECMRMLTRLRCESREKIAAFVVELDYLFGEFEALECKYPESLKKLALLERIESAAPDVYGAVIKDESLGYTALTATVRRMAALDSAMGRAIKTEELESQAFPIKTYRQQKGKSRQSLPQRKKISWRPERDQCLWCLKKGHHIADCRSKVNGEPSRIRPDGSRFEDLCKREPQETVSFATQCFTAQTPRNGGEKQQSWLVDSGCNRHMTPFKDDFKDLKVDNTPCRFGNNRTSKAEGKGCVVVNCEEEDGGKENIMLNNVLYMPLLPYRILSTPCLRKAGGRYTDSPDGGEISLKSGCRLPLVEVDGFQWLKCNGMCSDSRVTSTLEDKAIAATVFAPGARETAEASLIDWHESLGHSHPASILFLEQRGLIKITGNKTLDEFNCRICSEAKSTVPHYRGGTRSIKRPGELVHIDLAGPFEPDMHEKTYLMVFVDEATRFKSVFGLKTYQEGMQLAGTKLRCIRGDGAGEFGRSKIFRQELGNLGLQWESSPPYTHQQQGLVERAIRQITEGGRAQLARSYLGNDYWFLACQDFTLKSNCLPHQSLGGDSPYERLHPGRKPRYQAFRKFGQTAYVHIDKTRQGNFSRGKLNKMRPRAERGVLVGHASGAAAYIVHLIRLNKIVTSSAVTFDDIPATTPFLSQRPDHWESPAPGIDDAAHLDVEEEPLFPDNSRHSVFDGRDMPRPHLTTHGERQGLIKAEETAKRTVPGPEIGDPETSELLEQNGATTSSQVGSCPRRSPRVRQQFDPSHMPSGTREMENLTRMIEEDSSDEDGSLEECCFTYCMLADTSITVEEALASPEAEDWKDAIAAEERGLQEKGVLVKAQCPTDIRPLKTRYVLSKKLGPDGSVIRYKARRVVQGFHQTYGKDFFETFSPVVGFDTLRLVLGLAAWHGWPISTMDFKQAYLNSGLEEEVYVKNPDGITEKLNKALYGLKQAGFEWNKTLKSRIKRGRLGGHHSMTAAYIRQKTLRPGDLP